jgi:dTDP-4-dehydrorhamnose 3,5-epimerase-like enzyme
MKIKNIINNCKYPLEIHRDNRGVICDIFYKKKINHVTYIKSYPNKIRGNHFHKKTTQIILITSGELEYWYKKIKSKERPKMVLLRSGDLLETPPYEVHALRTRKKSNEFIVFSWGPRGGKDYEKDTYRVESIIE